MSTNHDRKLGGRHHIGSVGTAMMVVLLPDDKDVKECDLCCCCCCSDEKDGGIILIILILIFTVAFGVVVVVVSAVQ